jgi:anthranilate synthase component 1
MQIIDELEPSVRGPYAGALGYFSFNGSCDFAITIRSLFVNGDKAYVQSGAGIVIDSDPELEWAETEHKANAIISALKGTASGSNIFCSIFRSLLCLICLILPEEDMKIN